MNLVLPRPRSSSICVMSTWVMGKVGSQKEEREASATADCRAEIENHFLGYSLRIPQ